MSFAAEGDRPHFVLGPEAVFPDWLPALPGDQLLSLERIPFTRPVPLSAAALVAKLTGVDNVEDAGSNGMAIACEALDDSLGQGLFETEFGRDALIMASFVADLLPDLTKATVARLAEVQGTENRLRDAGEEPDFDLEEIGRIPHEIRDENDPLAEVLTAQYGWDWPYYGSVDATCLFVSAAVRAFRRSPSAIAHTVLQRDGFERTLGESFVRALAWIETRLQADPDGLLSTRAASNGSWQVWEDSIDAYHDQSGRLARGEVAAVELQAWAFDALLQAARLYETRELGEYQMFDPSRAQALRDKAHALRRIVIERMWLSEKGGYFAAGYQRVDGNGKPLTLRKGNMGLMLTSDFLVGEEYRPYVEAIVDQLFMADGTLLCPSGIRTLASNEARFRPGSYQNGSVWPWQNLWIARGLRFHGFEHLAVEIEHRIMKVVNTVCCFPEFVLGSDDETPAVNEASVWIRSPDGNGATYLHQVIQPPQKYQGWTVFGMYALERAGKIKPDFG